MHGGLLFSDSCIVLTTRLTILGSKLCYFSISHSELKFSKNWLLGQSKIKLSGGLDAASLKST